MRLYDDIIRNIKSLMTDCKVKALQLSDADWPNVSDHSMILRSDMAYELGSGQFPGLGVTLVTDDKSLVEEDGVFLCGKDLPELTKDVPFARIALVRVKPESMGEGNTLYNAIRKLEYTRYHFYPEGFMMRVSSIQNKESVRVSKGALKNGLDFSKTGNSMRQAFKKHDVVEAVQIFYVTDFQFPFGALETYKRQSETVTKAIDHILKDVKMDCNVCSLQKVCDEIEGLRELHFSQETR